MEIEIGKLIKKAKLIRCGDGEYPVLSMTMHDGLMFQNDRFKKQIASVDQSQYQVVQRHQLVESFPIDEGVLAVQELTDAGIVSPAYKIWDVDMEKVVPKYLEFALRAPKSIEYYKFKLRGTTARRRSIPDAEFCAMRIKCPSLDEQKIIVDTIEKTKRVIDSRNLELDTLDDLIKARFVEMFGDENNSKKWDIVNVEEVADVQVGVVIKPSQYYTDESNGIRAFRSLNIGEGFIKNNDWVYFTEEGHQKNSKSILKENDLLIVRSGAPGTACVVTEEYVGSNAIDIIIAHPDCEKVNPCYLCTFTNMPHGKKQIEEGTGGAAQQHFNVGKYNKLQLMMPPKALQDEFVEFVHQVDKSKLLVQKSLDETQMLFNSLMQKYFG